MLNAKKDDPLAEILDRIEADQMAEPNVRHQADFDRLFPKGAPAPNGFEAWMAQVDAALVKRCGLTSADLPDYCYADDYEDGATPRQAAVAAIHAAKEF
jgi:hypothetical protein